MPSTAEQEVQPLRSLRSTGDESQDIEPLVGGVDDRAPLVSFLNTIEVSVIHKSCVPIR